MICFALIYDVTTNGYLKTDLDDVGVLLLFDGAYVAGSGAQVSPHARYSASCR